LPGSVPIDSTFWGIKRTRETLLDRFAACFEDFEYPRSGNAALHDFHTLLIIILCTVLCGGQGCVDMALFAEAKEPFLREFLDLRNGPPNHDTFSRLFRRLDPDQSGWRFNGS
jgi:hypothetical protein